MKKTASSLFTLIILVTSTLLPAQNSFKSLADNGAASLFTGKNPLKGAVIGIIKENLKEVFGYGELLNGTDTKEPGNLYFEVASLTKNLTSLLLARSVSEGLVKYDDIAYIIQGKNITWEQLVTHTSGIPAMPANYDNSTSYSVKEFEAFLKECKLASEPGTKFGYSTAGYALLGKLIAEKKGCKNFDECIINQILKPFGLLSSGFDPVMINMKLYTGDTLTLKKKKAGFILNPSGGIISTANDLLQLININSNPELYPELSSAIKLTQQTVKGIATFPGSIAALGWHFYTPMKIFWNTGVGAKSRVLIMFDPEKKCGIVILTNTKMEPNDSRLEMTGFTMMNKLRQLK